MLANIGFFFCITIGFVGFLLLGYALAYGAIEYIEGRKFARSLAARREAFERARRAHWEK